MIGMWPCTLIKCHLHGVEINHVSDIHVLKFLKRYYMLAKMLMEEKQNHKMNNKIMFVNYFL